MTIKSERYPEPDYGMFTAEGSEAVANVVKNVKWMTNQQGVARDRVFQMLYYGLKVMEADHEEVFDTAVVESILGAIADDLMMAGIEPIEYLEFLDYVSSKM